MLSEARDNVNNGRRQIVITLSCTMHSKLMLDVPESVVGEGANCLMPSDSTCLVRVQPRSLASPWGYFFIPDPDMPRQVIVQAFKAPTILCRSKMRGALHTYAIHVNRCAFTHGTRNNSAVISYTILISLLCMHLDAFGVPWHQGSRRSFKGRRDLMRIQTSSTISRRSRMHGTSH